MGFSQFLDIVDGAIAKKFGIARDQGAAVDRIIDRVNDSVAIITLAILSRHYIIGLVALALVIIASYMSSVYETFTKSRRGEGLSKRWVRIGFIALGYLTSFYIEALIVLILIALLSIWQRAQKIGEL